MFKKYFIGLMVLFTTLQGLMFFSTPQTVLAIPFYNQLDAPPKSIQVLPITISGKPDQCAARINWSSADTSLIKNTLGSGQVDYYIAAQRTDNNKIEFYKTTSGYWQWDTSTFSIDTDSIPCDVNYIFSVATRYNGTKIAYIVSTPSPYRITNQNFISGKSTAGNVNCPPGVNAPVSYGADGKATVILHVTPNTKTKECEDNYTVALKDTLDSKKWIQYKFNYTIKTIESMDGSATTKPIPISETTKYTVTAWNQAKGINLGSTDILVTFKAPTKKTDDKGKTVTTPVNQTGTTTTGGTSGTSGTTGGTTTTGGTSGTTAGEAESICVKDCGGVAFNKMTDAGSQIRNAMCKMQCSTLSWFADIIKYMFVNILAQSIL